MRKVVSPQEVAHLWANQVQDEARNAGNSLFFYGDTIYSYGHHFAIAKHVEHNGVKACLFTTRKYSVTTSAHTSFVSSAANHLNLIYVPFPDGDFEKNARQFERNIKNALASIVSARKPEKYLYEARVILGQLEKYADFMGEPVPDEAKEMINIASQGEWAQYLADEEKREAEREEKAMQARQKKLKEDLIKWRNNKLRSLWGRLGERDYLRVSADGLEIETTQGISIPLDMAKRSFKFVMAAMKRGGCTDCKHKILHYEVTSITPTTLTVGCHAVDLKEINRVAKKLNWI